MDYAGKKGPLTGASGFAGSHLAEERTTCGDLIRGFPRNDSGGKEGNLKYVASEIRREVDTVDGDLTDAGALIAIPALTSTLTNEVYEQAITHVHSL